jgi:ribosome-associated protein
MAQLFAHGHPAAAVLRLAPIPELDPPTMQNEIDETAAEEEEQGPSKSARKRHSHDLQGLGEALIELPQAELDALALPEVLFDAVMLARRITAHGGLYRQKQYIGKLMRKIDSEPIRAAIQARQNQSRAQAVKFRQVENWRNRLLSEPDALNELAVRYPAADRELLQRLIAQSHWETQHARAPKAARELFTALQKLES